MAKNFEILKEDVCDNDYEQNYDYFIEFFSSKNKDNYEIPSIANEKEREAVEYLFKDGIDLNDRVNRALEIDEYCVEALFIDYKTYEEPFVEVEFIDYYNRYNSQLVLTPYQKLNYQKILVLYADFESHIGNKTRAIKTYRHYLELSDNYDKENMNTLAFLYNSIESKDDFYKLYLEHEFNDPVQYLLLTATLLKHDEYDKAKEVLNDMIDCVKCADYIDHMWELNATDKDAELFKEAVDCCFDYISALPNFFSFARDNKEKKLQS